MDYHPYTEIWPLLEGEHFDALKADIAAHGLRLPILTYQDKVLDGRNRERACEAVGVEPRYMPAQAGTDEEALALVVSLNMHRRHLTLAQRAFAASRLANILHGHNRHRDRRVRARELYFGHRDPTRGGEARRHVLRLGGSGLDDPQARPRR